MAYCSNCGAYMDDQATICRNCGVPVKKETSNDNGGFGWGLLGFCIPIVGIILYFVWKDEKPVTAESVCTGAKIAIVLEIVISILSAVIGALA